MAEIYDPEVEGTTSPSSSSSTGGGGVRFSRPGQDRQADNLDPVRRAEAGGRRSPSSSSTGSAGGGGRDSAGRSDRGDPWSKSSTPAGSDGAKSSTDEDNPDSLKDREENPGWAKSFSDGKSNRTGRFRITRRRAAIGTGVAAGAGGATVAFMLILAPLKIESVVQQLQTHFSATSQAALENESDTLFKKYIVQRVIPGYNRCGTTVSRHCSAISVTTGGGNPVTKLFNAWSQARIENQMADKGIELVRKPSGWYLKTPSDKIGQNTGKKGENIDQAFKKANPGEIHQAFRDQTRGYQVYTRYVWGRFAEEKYGAKRCIISCTLTGRITDPLYGKIDEQKTAAKILITQRIVEPHAKSLGLALECLLTDCDPTKTTPGADTGAPATNGESENLDTEVQISQGMRDLATKYGLDEAAVKAAQETYNKIAKDGFQKWLVKEGLAKLGASTTTQAFTADAIPVVGQINLAATIVDTANNAGPKVKKLRYITNSTSDVQVFMMFRTYADEIHTGHLTATEAGSLTKELGRGASSGPDKPEVGGTASAENTPLWQRLINRKKSVSASGAAGDYKCNNGKTVNTKGGDVVCPEEALGGGNSLANSLHDLLNTFPFSVITTIAQIWHDTVGRVYSAASGIVGDIANAALSIVDSIAGAPCGTPAAGLDPYCKARDLAKSASSTIVEAVMKWLIPNPFSAKQSGGRTFGEIAAGADVINSETSQHTTGGKRLTATQTAVIRNQQEHEALQQFQHQSFFARMFSTDSQYSLLSKMAVAIPFDYQSSAQSSFASLTSNPFGVLVHSFGSLFTRPASAISQNDALLTDPFAVPQYGYTQLDLDSIGDPEAYWDQHCTDDPSTGYQKDNSWNVAASSTIDPDTGMPENTSTNPCILIKNTVGSFGATSDASLLPPDDLADVNGSGNSTNSTAAAGGYTNPFPKSWAPGRLDMGYDGTFTGQIVAPFTGTITYASTSFSNWGGYIEIKALQKPGWSANSSTLYFAEGVKPAAGIHAGAAVTAGQPIADAYTTGAQAGIPGNIEWGIAQDGNVGTPTNTYVYGQCGSASARDSVMNFSQWAQQTLHVAAPSSTGSAGCP